MNSIPYTAELAQAVLSPRAPESHKDHYGRVLAVCGCRGYTGSAWFAAMGAVRTGAGVVTLAVPESIYPILAVKLNEPVVLSLPDRDGKLCPASLGTLEAPLLRADALLIGPGLGRSAGVTQAVLTLLQTAKCPVVLDADGINAINGHIDVLQHTAHPVILTPHGGEFARLSGIPQASSQDLSRFAAENRCIVLSKRHRTLVAAPGGQVFQNTTGNPGMAKGGSGDVLAGMILALLGQGVPPLDAACAGAWFHGRAGDRCANRIGEYGMTPTDLLGEIPAVLHYLNSKEW